MENLLSLDTTLKQQQRLTPMQVQYVKMLEMNTPEIEDAVRRAIDEMPALEANEESTDEDNRDSSVDSASKTDDTPYYLRRTNNRSAQDEYYDITAAAPQRSETLMEALEAQLLLTNLDETDRLIATNIIGNLDDNGYITRDLQSIADDMGTSHGLLVDSNHVKHVWQQIRNFDPAGIGAVDLRDCLLLQLQRMPKNKEVANATEIISHYYDMFAKMHFDRIKTAIGLTDSQLKAAMDVIKRLNPKPGSAYASGRVDDDMPSHVVPDFAIDIDGDNLILTMLTRIPELSIERTFMADTPITRATIQNPRKEAANMFLRTKREEAQAFIKVLSMRQETLYRVMQAIIKIQRQFFLTGDESLIKPMILKDIKELTGYGISVISRATAGKYVTTPYGTYALKSLFNERPKDDTDLSAHAIFARLKELIASEDTQHPLSDEQLTRQLATQGYDIARRTVAKYRERLGYPVARLRKKV